MTISTTTRRLTGSLRTFVLSVVLLIGLSPGGVMASAVDEYTQFQLLIDQDLGGPEVSASVSDLTTILGEERDLNVNSVDGLVPDSSRSVVLVNEGVLSFSSDSNVVGMAIAQWDGVDGVTQLPPVLPQFGLNTDLTQGGTVDALEYDVLAADKTFSYRIEAYTDTDHYSRMTLQQSAIAGDPVTVTLPYQDFLDCDNVDVVCGPGGPVDFEQLGALQLLLNTDPVSALDMSMSPITTVLTGARLGDFVWEDCNGNGLQDDAATLGCDGGAGIPGVTVNLLTPGVDGVCGTDDEQEAFPGATMPTDADGIYLFTGLDAGNYCVEFVRPAGFECTLANQGMDNAKDSDVVDQGDGTCQTVDPDQNPIALGESEIDRSWDAGLVRPASLGDRVWNDLVRNNVQDSGDADLADTVVTLLDCDGNRITEDLFGNPVGPITTDDTGFYEFINLRPGSYQVSFQPPAGFTFVTPKVDDGNPNPDERDSDAVLQGDGTGLTACTTLVSGENNPNIDAGLFEIAESRLGDLVWNDLNADGIQDNINGTPDGEPGIEGVTVELWQCADGSPTDDTGRTETTNASGFYAFENLAAGSYAVKFPVDAMKADGWKVSPQNVGDEDKDSDADPTTGFTACVDLGIDDENLDLDAGFYKPAMLGDRVWNDLVRNNVQDPGDADLAGTVVTLEDCFGNLVATDVDGNPINPITTDADGAYKFTNLAPGGYQVRFAPTVGFSFVTPKVGTDDTSDSDAVPQGDGTGLSACTTLVSGEHNPNIDAGLFEISTSHLGDLVWNDLNADGIQDNINGDPNGEPGIPGVEVELWQCDAQGNPTTDTGSIATTNASGFYIFINLTAGNYAVRFPVDVMTAAGWKVSPQNVGVDDKDSDADPTTGFTACVALGVADENLDLDAGFFKPASLGDFVWDDDSVNRNDVQDPNEAGIAGTEVTLEDCFGNPVTDVDGIPISPITTDDTGFYGFTNLGPGDYQVRFVPPANYEFVTPNAGAENVDSDAIPQADGSGLTQCVTLISGENNPDIDAGLFLAIPACDLTVEKSCQIVEAPPAQDFVCSDAKPLDTLTMISAEQREISSIAYYRDKFDPNDPGKNLIGTIPGPINLDDEVAASGYAAAAARNDVDWVMTFADGTTGVSRFHRSCSDPEMNGPEDCGKLEGNSKDDRSELLNIWQLEGLAGNGLVLDCTASDPVPSTVNECEFSTPAAPHCLGKVEAISFRYLDGDCLIDPNTQEGKANCVLPGAAGEPVQIVVSDGGSKVYLDTGSPGTVSVGDIVMAAAANAGVNEFGSSSVIEIFSETGTLVQEVEFHTSCSKPLNLGDRFGSVDVVGLDTTDGGSASLGAEIRYDYKFTNNIPFPFTGKAVDDKLGTVLDPLSLAPTPDAGSVVATSKTVFVLPDDTDVFTNTVTVTAENGAFCGDASATVTRVPPPPAPVTCSDIKPITTLSMVWDGPSGVNVTTEGGELFENVQAGNQITFSAVGLGNDVDLTLSDHVSGAVIGMSRFHVSCSDQEMNGSEDCGSNQGDGKGNDSSLINEWLFDGMTGEKGSFACDVPNTGVVDPTPGAPGGGDVTGAATLDLGDAKKAKWELTNNGSQDVFITRVVVSWPAQHEKLKKFKLAGDFAKDVNDTTSPTAVPDDKAFESDPNKRKLKKGETRKLEIEFDKDYKEHTQSDYTITVEFDNGQTLSFP